MTWRSIIKNYTKKRFDFEIGISDLFFHASLFTTVTGRVYLEKL